MLRAELQSRLGKTQGQRHFLYTLEIHLRKEDYNFTQTTFLIKNSN